MFYLHHEPDGSAYVWSSEAELAMLWHLAASHPGVLVRWCAWSAAGDARLLAAVAA